MDAPGRVQPLFSVPAPALGFRPSAPWNPERRGRVGCVNGAATRLGPLLFPNLSNLELLFFSASVGRQEGHWRYEPGASSQRWRLCVMFSFAVVCVCAHG